MVKHAFLKEFLFPYISLSIVFHSLHLINTEVIFAENQQNIQYILINVNLDIFNTKV